MYILEDRLDCKYAIKILKENMPKKLSKEILEKWLSPFFRIEEIAIDPNTHVVATIEFSDESDSEIQFIRSGFILNTQVELNRLCYNLLIISRTLYKTIACKNGLINLHAACLVNNDKGILLISERNQGKTTVLLHALNQGFSFLANDQVMISPSNVLVLGYPALIGIRNNSVSDYNTWVQLSKKKVCNTSDPFQIEQKPLVLISDIAHVFKCKTERVCKLSIVVIYHKTDNKDSLIVSQISDVKKSILNFVLPLKEACPDRLLQHCIEIANILFGHDKKSDELLFCEDDIQAFDVLCGINRIQDFLSTISTYITP